MTESIPIRELSAQDLQTLAVWAGLNEAPDNPVLASAVYADPPTAEDRTAIITFLEMYGYGYAHIEDGQVYGVKNP